MQWRDSEATLPYANSAPDLSAQLTSARNGRTKPVTFMIGAHRRVFLAEHACARSVTSPRAGSRVLLDIDSFPQTAWSRGRSLLQRAGQGCGGGAAGGCGRFAAYATALPLRGWWRQECGPAARGGRPACARRLHRGCALWAQKTRKTDVFQDFCDRETGRGDRIRTCDLYVPNVALYQTELHPEGAAHDTGVARIRQDPLRKNFSRRRPGRRPRGPRTTCR